MTKEEQRRAALEARRALTAEERVRFSAEIRRRLTALLYDWRGKTLFSYLPQPDEADVYGLDGFVTAWPVAQPGGLMEAYIPGPGDTLAAGLLGIRQPDPEKGRLVLPEDIDVVIAPCVAFDEKCRRLGHGGGYYDRYLRRCPRALVIAAAFEAQRLDEIATEENDMPAHIVVTEERVYLPG